MDEEVGPRRVERGGGRAVELEEAEDPLARLGRQLRRLGRGDERADHVELAPPRDLHAAREVDRAQLDRRAGERADDGARVGGVDEQPQPREHVLDLGALEERRRARQAVRARRAPRAPRRPPGPRCAPSARAPRSRSGAHPRADEPLDLGRDGLGLGALVRRAPEAHLAAGRGRRGACRRGRRSAGRRPPARPRTIRSGQRSDCSRRTVRSARAASAARSLRFFGRRAAQAADRLVVVAGGRQRRRARRREQEDEPRSRRSSRSWTSSTSTWR